MKPESVRTLSLNLHGRHIGYLAGYENGTSIAAFEEDYVLDPNRPTLTLAASSHFPKARQLLSSAWIRQQRLHPVFSNMLPEGALREWLAQRLQVHPDHEFPLMAALGRDLPGALIASPVAAEAVPDWVLSHRTSTPAAFDDPATFHGFSLPGVQMKFSMRMAEGRFRLGLDDEPGDWIVKTPSQRFAAVPENEYSAMKLAEAAGVVIPEMRLISTGTLDGLPSLNVPCDQPAFAIKRFDREDGERIHIEDFAQILFKYPHDKYRAANYEQVTRLIYEYTGDPLRNVQETARRLLVNLLLANGDAHLKNWSLIYPDGRQPELAPAYDIVATRAYMDGERQAALNLNRRKDWYGIGWEDFRAWARHADIPWGSIEPTLRETLQAAREQWPRLLRELPMAEAHKQTLHAHWRQLKPEWRIG
ncbi:type II toxin-antitoxin system HipA family toxin [Vreelandella utahensis]|uniref:type II toxin-antitoxin system HipA family toxin n=1 Tax=Vreelandella halophila TaxID=86177 RepID=UPI00098430DF|nr:type II toxin-antitoxin system HipA family toxin [Halomonas utahensis]